MVVVILLAVVGIAALSWRVGVLSLKKSDKSKIVAIPTAFTLSLLALSGLAVLFGFLLDIGDQECPVLMSDDGGCVQLMLLYVIVLGAPVFPGCFAWLAIASAIDGRRKQRRNEDDAYR